jgi:hypothetical protein
MPGFSRQKNLPKLIKFYLTVDRWNMSDLYQMMPNQYQSPKKIKVPKPISPIDQTRTLDNSKYEGTIIEVRRMIDEIHSDFHSNCDKQPTSVAE